MLSRLKIWILLISFLMLAALPFVAEAIDEPFYVDLMARVMIFSIAAMSLDFILGLIPVVGDIIAAVMGTWLVWEARNLNMPKWKIARMFGNIGVYLFGVLWSAR